MTGVFLGFSGEDSFSNRRFCSEGFREVIRETTWKMKDGFLGNVRRILEFLRRAFPPDFDAGLKIGFGARHVEKFRSAKLCGFAKYFSVRMEPNFGAATIFNLAFIFDFSFWQSSLKPHCMKCLISSDFNFEHI